MNIKKLLNNLQRETKNSDWQKMILYSTFLGLCVLFLAIGYLLIKPMEADVINLVNTQVSEDQIKFDSATLAKLKNRQQPPAAAQPSANKNPFTPF